MTSGLLTVRQLPSVGVGLWQVERGYTSIEVLADQRLSWDSEASEPLYEFTTPRHVSVFK